MKADSKETTASQASKEAAIIYFVSFTTKASSPIVGLRRKKDAEALMDITMQK